MPRPRRPGARDVRIAIRRLAHSPAFLVSSTAILTLGLSATLAAFAVVEPLLLRRLPLPAADRLVLLHSKGTRETVDIAPFRFATAYAEARDVLEHVAADAGGGRVSANYFEAIGVRAHLGRMPGTADVGAERPPLVLSHGYWTRAFGGDPGAIGRTIEVGGRTHEIVAVAPPGFFGLTVGETPDTFRPSTLAPGAWVRVVATLRPSVTPEQAAARLSGLFDAPVADTGLVDAERREVMAEIAVTPIPRGLSNLRERVGPSTQVLAGVVVVVWLIACANVAVLALTRFAGRATETAVRLSLGGSRVDAAMPMLIEGSAVVAIASGAALALAPFLTRVAIDVLAGGSAAAAGVRLPPVSDPAAIAGAALASVATLALGAIAPALHAVRSASRQPHAGAGAGRSLAAGRPTGAQQALVTAQVALSVALVSVAGLFVHSLVRLNTADPGFDREAVIGATLTDSAGNRPAGDFQRTLDAILSSLRAQPSVAAASLASVPPFGGVEIGVNVRAEPGGEPLHTYFGSVGSQYFEALGLPLRLGRGCDGTDTPASMPVAIVNARLANRLFGADDPLGRQVRFVQGQRPPFTIVGVASDAMYTDVREAPRQFLYLCSAQQPPTRLTRATIFVRSTGDDASPLASLVERTVAAADARVTVSRAETMGQIVRGTFVRDRALTSLLTGVSLTTLAIAAVGVYGVLATSVVRRTREIGVRAALGAGPGRIAAEVLARPAALMGAGLATGVGVSWLTRGLFDAQLYGVPAVDAASFSGVAATLAIAGALACMAPAIRAIRVDPAAALRRE